VFGSSDIYNHDHSQIPQFYQYCAHTIIEGHERDRALVRIVKTEQAQNQACTQFIYMCVDNESELFPKLHTQKDDDYVNSSGILTSDFANGGQRPVAMRTWEQGYYRVFKSHIEISQDGMEALTNSGRKTSKIALQFARQGGIAA
jgi:hypothetical protein